MLGRDYSSKKAVNFSDGRLRGIRIHNGKIESNLSDWYPCGTETVGMNRFFRSVNADRTISKVVSIPYEAQIANAVYVELSLFRSKEKEIYKVIQLQELEGTMPKSLQLSLQIDRTAYDDLRRS